VQVLRPDPEKVDPDFLGWVLYELQRTGIIERVQQQSTQMRNLNWRDYQRLLLPWPDPDEQRRIAAALKLADDAIAKAKAELEATRELKRSLMQTLFVSGMPGRHSEFVETKIGPVPKGWQVKQLGEVLVSSQYGLSESMAESGRFPILRMNNMENGIVNADDVKYIDLDDTTFEIFRLRAGDILFNRTNSMEYVGRVGILNEDMDAVFASYLVRLVADTSQVDPWFLNFCMNSTQVKNRYRRYATPAVQQANINPRNLKKTLIAFPSLEDSDEQHEINELLRSVDGSIISLNKKVEALQQVKKSLLQNLLTGKIRIPEGAIHG
jgi:type I restriction enzyme S subunit